MGKEIVKFNCVSCGHCCTDVICLPTPWDVNRIAKETGEHPHDFLEFVTPDDISEVRKSDPTWLRIDGRRYMMALRRGPRGCYFLNKSTRKCNIYLHRPILCRLYPFRLHETRDQQYSYFDLHTGVGCPKHRENEVAARPLYALYQEDARHQQDYMDLVEVFNRRKDAGLNPADFIAMFYARKRA